MRSTSSKSILLVLGAAGAVVLLALAGFWLTGASGGDGGGDAAKGGGKDGGGEPAATYDKDHTRVRVAAGDRFALKVKENPGTGYAWVVDPPKPDGAVVRQTGKRLKGSSPGRVGAGGDRFLDFRAEAPGRTRVKLRSCFRCGTSYEQTDADHKATTLTFDVTVQK